MIDRLSSALPRVVSFVIGAYAFLHEVQAGGDSYWAMTFGLLLMTVPLARIGEAFIARLGPPPPTPAPSLPEARSAAPSEPTPPRAA